MTIVIFQKVLVKLCALLGGYVNVGVCSNDERWYFYIGEGITRDLFLPLIIKLCKRMDMPKENYYTLVEYDVAINPLRGRGSWRERKNKTKVGDEGKRS